MSIFADGVAAYVLDVETYPNLFLIGMLDFQTDKVKQWSNVIGIGNPSMPVAIGIMRVLHGLHLCAEKDGRLAVTNCARAAVAARTSAAVPPVRRQ